MPWAGCRPAELGFSLPSHPRKQIFSPEMTRHCICSYKLISKLPRGGKPKKKRSLKVSFFLKKRYFWGGLLVCTSNGNGLFHLLKPFVGFFFFFFLYFFFNTLMRRYDRPSAEKKRKCRRRVSPGTLGARLLEVLVYLYAAEKELQINSPKQEYYAILPSLPLSARWAFLQTYFHSRKKDTGCSSATLLQKHNLSTNLPVDGRQRERNAAPGNSHETPSLLEDILAWCLLTGKQL